MGIQFLELPCHAFAREPKDNYQRLDKQITQLITAYSIRNHLVKLTLTPC